MARDNVTFSFRIDSARASASIKELTRVLEKLGATSIQTGGKLNQTEKGVNNLGKSAASSAVNFQTGTQGLLNLSTAAVQTYTSISNLDRANNRARMSIIAVARAADLLNSKKQRLNEMEAAGVTSGGKYVNMQREIATAVADHTEKLEKQKIEQAAVNDVYMLFATNIANVVISSTQTIVILLGHERSARLASAVATKLQTSAVVTNTKAMFLQIKSINMLKITTLVGTAINAGFTGSIVLMTKALRGFMSSHPILLGMMAASVLAFAAYETNFRGIKDAIDNLMPTEKDHISLLAKERAEMDALNGTIDAHVDKVFKLPRTYSEAASQLKVLTKQLEESNKVFEKHPNFRPASEAGGNQTANGLSIVLPTAYASEVDPYDSYLPKNYGQMAAGAGSFSMSGSPTAFGLGGRALGTGGLKVQEEFLASEKKSLIKEIQQNELSIYGNTITFSEAEAKFNSGSIPDLNIDLQKRLNAYFEGEKLVIQRLSGGGFATNVVEDKTILAGLKQYTPETYALEQHREIVKEQVKAITDKKETELKIEADSLHISVDELKRRRNLSKTSTYVPGIGNVDKGQVDKIKESRQIRSSLLQGDLSSLPTDTMFDRLVKDSFSSSHKNSGLSPFLRQGSLSGKIYDTDELNLMFAARDFSPSRKAAYDKYGVDIGKAADNYSEADAERFGMYQATGNAMNGQVGGQQYTNLFSSFGGSATQAYQVDKLASSPTLTNFHNRVRRGNSFVNGRGGLMLNAINIIKGGRMITSSAFRSMNTHIAEAEIIQKAVQMGIKSAPGGWMDMVAQVPEVNIESEDNMAQALSAMGSLALIASQYISRVEGAKSAVGFTSSTLETSKLFGFSGASLYHNIMLLSNTKRTNFSNTEIAEESKNKLSLTNSQTFAIRFNSTRGDTELQDRFRYVDQLEAMSSGTSPL